MVSFQQLMHCQPQKFSEAGQTYRRMAEGFGKVEGVLKQANAVLSNNTDWVGIAQKQALNRSTTLTKGIQAGGQETNAAGTALTTLGTALTTAQTALRAAVAEAMTGPLIMTPEGQTIIPPWAYVYPASVEELPRLKALKAIVDVQIKAALTSATAADMAAAAAIAKLAIGQLIKDFGSSHAPTSANNADAAATMGTPAATALPSAYADGATVTNPDTSAELSSVAANTTGASTNGNQVNTSVTTSDWRGMSADGNTVAPTQVADANGGQVVSGTIGTAAVASGAASTAATAGANVVQQAQNAVGGAAQTNAQQLPQQYQQYLAMVNEAAARHNVDPAVLLGIMDRETGDPHTFGLGGNNIIGDHGHGHGLMQIDDRSHGDWLRGHQNGMDPATNIDYAATILADNMRRFPGNLDAAVAAYNAGGGNVNRAIRAGHDVNTVTAGHNYASDVLNRADWFRGMLPTGGP
jgi:Transglycosylase SLT domain